jgi:peptide/nickel transport system substrate-binding protein
VRSPHRLSVLVALMLSLALVAGACGKDDDSKTSAGKSGADTAGPAADANDINQKDRGDVQDGGTLKWTISSLPSNWNPNHLDGTERDTTDIMAGLLPSPFDTDAKGDPVLKKEYVESAELTAKTPKQIVTYKLNKKAKWSDGTPITVADYEGMWKAHNGKDEAFQVASTTGYEDIETVAKGSDEYEVVVTFSTPYVDWQGLFSDLLPVSTTKDAKVYNEGWVDKPLASAGPFKFEGVDQTAKTATTVRDEKWWGDKAKLDKIIYRAIDVDAQIDALANGEVDFVDVGPDVDTLQRAKTTPNVIIRKAGGPNFRHVDFNGASEVLKDVDVRTAIALGINRATIAKALIGPLGVPAVPLNNHIFMSNQAGYKNNAGQLATPDPAKAMKLLDTAGWKVGTNGIREKGGKPLSVRIVIPSQVATSQKESELMQGMLKPIGVDLKIDVVPTDDFFDKYINVGNWDMTVFSWIGTPFPISSSKGIYGSVTGEDLQQNYGRIGTPEIDALYKKVTTEFDIDKARDLANQIDGLIWKEVHSLTSYQRPDIFATKTGLANFGAAGFATLRYEDIGFVKA